MKGKRIWIRQHPNEPSNYEVTLDKPNEEYGTIHSHYAGGESAYVKWHEWVAFQLEDE
ncbi:hypothetical protein [Vibrio phage VpV262]|uniref:Uncharacterized protein n=1 Tax=Vibrio phage VpV262 TaxID=2907796 RepID=Q8LT83_9CAUD|nr:hypothetical protein VpV262p18 [Vibrio phage VpV262]AAM28366.1 hypothetical protein [Vibrio phage VpV262]